MHTVHTKKKSDSKSCTQQWPLMVDLIPDQSKRSGAHQRDLAPVDVKLSSELLITADDGLHLLTAAQLILWGLHLSKARWELHVCSHHHIHTVNITEAPGFMHDVHTFLSWVWQWISTRRNHAVQKYSIKTLTTIALDRQYTSSVCLTESF